MLFGSSIEEMRWCAVDGIVICRVDVRVVSEVGSDGVLGDVMSLRFELGSVADAMFEVARLPYLAGRLFARRVGVAALDELDCLGCTHVDRWGQQDVDVVGHHGEPMKEKFTLCAVPLQRRQEESGIGRALKVPMLSERTEGDRIRGELLTLSRHRKRVYLSFALERSSNSGM
jgi:hypothetical protein